MTVNEYRKQALKGINDIIEQLRPQAEDNDDKEMLKLLDELEDLKDKGRASQMVVKLEEVKNKAEADGYTVNV